MAEVERLSNDVNVQLLDYFAGFKEKKESLRHLLCIWGALVLQEGFDGSLEWGDQDLIFQLMKYPKFSNKILKYPNFPNFPDWPSQIF